MRKSKLITPIFNLLVAVLLLAVSISCSNDKEGNINMETNTTIFPKGDKASSDFFTGNAYNYHLLSSDSTYTTIIGNVYFEPGARSNWHTHPAGQILIITDGVGYYQIEGEPVKEMKKGDVVKFPPNARHWHGASPETGVQQMYIVPNTEKGVVEWMEAVTDEEYNDLSNS